MNPTSIATSLNQTADVPEGFEAAKPGTFRASTVYFPDMASVRALDRNRFEGY